MKFSLLNILLFSLLSSQSLVGQNQKDTTAINNSVEDALKLSQEGNNEESIKECLTLLSIDLKLSLKDSFRVYRSLAHNLYQFGDFDNALNYAKTSLSLQFQLNNTKEKSYLFLMHFFNAAEQYDSSIYYMNYTVRSILEKKDENNINLLIKTYNNIGFTYYLNNQLDSAEVYYKKVINMPGVKENHSSIYGLATGNLGQIYFSKKEYKNAIKCMQTDAKLTKGKIWESYNNAVFGIAESYYELKEYKRAKKELQLLFSQKRQINKTLLKAYALMAKVLEYTNNGDGSAIYLKKYIKLNDSLIQNEKPKKEVKNQLSRTRINLVEQNLKLKEKEVELINNQLLLSENTAKTHQLKTRAYIITLILSLIFIILLFAYFKNRQKKNRAIRELEKELLEVEIKNKQKDLNNVVTNLSYKRSFIDDVQQKLKDLKHQPVENLSENLTSLIREFNTYKSADKNVEVLQSDIEKVNLSFFEALGKKYPLLTENEKELCGLLLLNLSSKDIANIRNISPNAVKKARQRIRKKLPIRPDEKITTFLSAI